ncbi:protein DDC8 homolog [Cavia porcellus]|uniref:protein DDC8 homolog n=1 Tax=Cavia porcellus TaxID=10141 RepID=UPI000661B1D1|nr:protein DDC8 homolog [Cavia porcellus]
MQRETGQAAPPSLAPGDRALAVGQKSLLLQAGLRGDIVPQRRSHKPQRGRQLQRLPEELRAEQREARPQQIRGLQWLYLTHLLGGATRWLVENEPYSEERVLRGAARSPGGRRKHREPLREERSRRDGPPRRRAWNNSTSLKKVTGLQRRAAPQVQCPGPTEKTKGKWAPSSQTSGGRQLVESRMGRRTDLEKLNPVLASAGEAKLLEEKEARAHEGMWQLGKRGHFAQGLRNNTERKLEDLGQLWLVSSTHKQGATPLASPHQCGDKGHWQKELESAVEELFNMSRKLKEHLTRHLESRPLADQSPTGEQVSERQGPGSDIPGEERTGQAETVPTTEVETSRTASQCSLLQLPSQAEGARDHPLATPMSKNEGQTLLPEDRVSVSGEDSVLQSPKPSHEPLRPATVAEGSPLPYLQEQLDLVGWRGSRLEQQARVEGRRQKGLLEQTEHPDMSLEIHYKAELEEERRERRRTRLALLRSYPTWVPTRNPDPVPRTHSPLSSSDIDEVKHDQMVRDFQRRISEQTKLHEQFLEKARKHLQELQKTW